MKKDSGRLYWNSTGGQLLAETDLNGSLITEYIYFLGQVVARREAGGTVYYFFRDHLGSPRTSSVRGSLRTITDSNGRVTRDSDYYPFGTERWMGGIGYDSHMFAGMERDSETGEYHTLFRQYSPNLGRWFSTDPVRGCVNFPQEQDLYTYVRDNPTSLSDPNGDYVGPGHPPGCGDPGCCEDPTCAEGCAECPSPPCERLGTCGPFPPGGGGGGGGTSGGQPPSPTPSNAAHCGACLTGCLQWFAANQLRPCVTACGYLWIYGYARVRSCLKACGETYTGEAATCGAAYAACLGFAAFNGFSWPPWPPVPPPRGYYPACRR